MGYESIIEGICPTDGATLERRKDHGRCPECGGGWSISGDTVRYHFSVEFGDTVDGSAVVDDA